MPWFKVDDKLHDHRKARIAKKAAMGVWVLAGSWCMDNLTDGFVPTDVLGRWGTKADANALVKAGLWMEAARDGEAGWQFHDWTRFQPSAAVTAATKAAEQEAGVRGNHQRWHVKRGITDPDCEYCYRVPDGPPDQVPDALPESGPESPPIPPEPVPHPQPHSEPDGSAAQRLIAEWIEHCAERPPGRVVGQVAREVKTMLDEGIAETRVRAGLAEWHRKGLHPSALASVVHEVSQRTPVTVPDDPDALPPPEQSWMRRRPS